MSQLDQAKKEAKRLYNLAKANPTNQITIPNLSSSRELMATINGYQDWHEYEEILKRKDFAYGKSSKSQVHQDNKEILSRQKYYIQDIKFNDIEYTKKSIPVIVKKEHIPIILGEQKEVKRFDKKKSWLLDSYPAMVLGATGSGKTEILLSMGKSFLDNGEGLIYMDGKGDVLIYTKIFSYAQSLNRLSDLYCLNFLKASPSQTVERLEKHSHSIDPINPMLGNINYFTKFFGKEFGVVLHAILKNIHQKSHLMDIQSLEATMMLNNLIDWSKDKFKGMKEINDYLSFLNLSNEYTDEDLEQALEAHAFCCETAYKTLEIFKKFDYIFKFDCCIDMEEIFLKRKMLLILMPALEKSPQYCSVAGELVASQIAHVENKLKEYKVHNQNIIVDDFVWYGNEFKNINFNESYNNYIFANQDVYPHTDFTDYLILNTNIYIFLKSEVQDIPHKLKIDIFDNFKQLPLKGFKKEMHLGSLSSCIREQGPGEALVFCNNNKIKSQEYINYNHEYYIASINCAYRPASRPKEVYLPEHKTIYADKK